jgi:hypothetical protein
VPCALQDGVIARKKNSDVFLQPKHIGVSLPVLPFARKFPCKRKFWYLQGKMQGNKIGKEIARKFSLKQGN